VTWAPTAPPGHRILGVKVLTLAATRSESASGQADTSNCTYCALVVLTLQTEVKLSRNTQGRWTFTSHNHPMRDSTLAQVISKLLATYLPGSK